MYAQMANAYQSGRHYGFIPSLHTSMHSSSNSPKTIQPWTRHSRGSSTFPQSSKFALIALVAGLVAANTALQAQSVPAQGKPKVDAGEANNRTDEAVLLDKLVISENADASPFGGAAARLATVPGSTRLIENAETLKGNPALSQKAIFDFQPGVYAQGSGTSESVKISIRGSGLAGAVTYNRSINLLFDGLTFAGFAMSGHSVAFNETLGLEYTEVLIGSNGFDYQSLGLGGAINYVSKTGYTASPFESRIDGGSFGYISAQVSTGAVSGKADYYASLVSSRSDGFQAQSAKESYRLISNIGYKFNDNVDTRFFLRFTPYIKQEAPGNLSVDQINQDPEQANAINLLTDNYQESKNAYWLGSKTTFQISPDSRVILGASYDDVPFTIHNRGAAAPNQLETIYDSSTLTYNLGYENEGELFSLERKTKIGFRGQEVLKGNNDSRNYSTALPLTFGQVVRSRDTDGTGNQVLSFSNDLGLTKDLWLRTGVSAIHTKTVNYVNVATPGFATGAINNANAVSEEDDYNYVLGLSYNLNPKAQVFANVSRSVEQPTALTKTNGLTNSNSKDLQNQIGITKEIGIRGSASIFDGSLSLYRTDLENEFITNLVSPVVSDTVNSTSDTVHQGIEAALTTTLWQDGGARNDPNTSKLTFRQSYTFNDFFFVNNASFNDNEIPSIPRNIYQGELRFSHSSGFYAAVNTRISSSYNGDYNNDRSFEVDGFTTWGATLGYQDPKGKWNAYVNFNNITDETYIVSTRPTVSTAANAGLGQTVQLHSVGDPFGIYAGIGFRF